MRRFVNPWLDAVGSKSLADRIDRYTEGFAVVSTLLCGLSAAALASIPQQRGNHDAKCPPSVLINLSQQLGFLKHSAKSEKHLLQDAYVAACCTSFFSGACALGLSTVLNSVGTVAPRSYLQSGLVLRHSLSLSAIPLFATASGGILGFALVVAIDTAMCSPMLTYLGIGQWAFTVSLIAGTAVRAQIGLVRAITASASAIARKPRRRIRARKSSN